MPTQSILTRDDYYFPVGVFLEGVFWGIYTVLFIAALWVWSERRSDDGTPTSTFSQRLYLVVITLMWLVASMHLGISIQRLMRVFILEIDVGTKPRLRLVDATKWDAFGHILLNSAMLLLADILVIYRTYVVWNRSLRIVLFPMLVHMAYLVSNVICTYGLTHPNRVPRKIVIASSQALFSFVFIQNVMTTALLTYKTYSTHRMARKNSTTNATPGAMGLGGLSWMLIETGMLYTMELLILIVLTVTGHPAMGTASVLLTPTLGIAFVLLSVRVHFSGRRTTYNWSTQSKVPNMLRDLAPDNNSIAVSRVSMGTQRRRPVTPLSLDGDIDMVVLTRRHHDELYDSEFDEDRHSESFPDQISQRRSQEW